jgi:uncharacterized membrane protein YedE/YeeE
MNALVGLLCGALFAAGACISGMVRPSKVLGFLDFGGAWDPSLALVMASALAVHVVAWRMVARSARPPFGVAFPPAPSRVIDAPLVVGAALFGVGWGLSGFCPGPAVVSIVAQTPASFMFVVAMAIAIRVTDRVHPYEP